MAIAGPGRGVRIYPLSVFVLFAFPFYCTYMTVDMEY
jgi:hypothetical protein